jgi:hypothetical protein
MSPIDPVFESLVRAELRLRGRLSSAHVGRPNWPRALARSEAIRPLARTGSADRTAQARQPRALARAPGSAGKIAHVVAQAALPDLANAADSARGKILGAR